MNRLHLFAPLAALTLAVAGCDTARAEHSAAESPHAAGAPAARSAAAPRADAPGELPGHSLYHLDTEWRDQDGAPRQLSSLAGRVQVVAMVYTHCAATCPQIVVDMKRLEGELVPQHDREVGFVLVSIDPRRDTPERLQEFGEGARLDPARWTLLSAGEEEILELAALLGVKYRRDGEAEFSHSNIITVLDRGGQIVHRQEGLGEETTHTLEAVRQQLR